MKKLHESFIELNLKNMDNVYTFYYDETNNIRRFHIAQNGLNIKEPQIFVLAGIVYKGSKRDLKVDKLKQRLELQKSTVDMKLKHLSRGDFLEILKSKKIEIFFQWILEENLLIHYYAMDIFYYAIVDIIDSVLFCDRKYSSLIPNHFVIKNDLYKIFSVDIGNTINIFKNYSYPDINKHKKTDFIKEIKNLLERNSDLIPNDNFHMLRNVLEYAIKLNTLPFIEDNEPYILIKDFAYFYMIKILIFKNSFHIFDDEKNVEELINTKLFINEEQSIKNYKFVNSKYETGIQIADIIAGLLGKYFNLLRYTDIRELKKLVSNFTQQQKNNLVALNKIMDYSYAESQGFLHFLVSLEDIEKSKILSLHKI